MPPTIQVDRSQWPIVWVRFPSEPLTDESLHAYLGQLSDICSEGHAYATISDLRPMRTQVTASQRLMFDEWMSRNMPQLDRVSVANAIVASTSQSRRVADTVFWRWRDPPKYRVFAGEEAAQDWCRSRIHRLAGGRRRRRVSTTPPPARSAAMAGVIDLFSEPAFLVTTEGEVVFANRAAREVFPPPRPWLVPAVSERDDSCTMPLQVARVTIDDRQLNLVVVGEGAAFAGLPPRLIEIARLISHGKTDKEIAVITGLATTSVRTYVRRLYARAGVCSRAELVRMWYLRSRRD